MAFLVQTAGTFGAGPDSRALEAWGRWMDAVVVAEDRGGASVGAAWYRRYGTPSVREVFIGVVKAWRRRGVAACLMEDLIAKARSESIPSLVVIPARGGNRGEADARAKLWKRFGFEKLEDGSWSLDLRTRLGVPP